MKILKNGLLVLVVVIVSISFGKVFGEFYGNLFNTHGSFVDVTGIFGIPFSYVFFLTLLFSAFGEEKKYWWIGIGLIPAMIILVSLDYWHIYFPLALGIIGWLIGLGLQKLIQKFKH